MDSKAQFTPDSVKFRASARRSSMPGRVLFPLEEERPVNQGTLELRVLELEEELKRAQEIIRMYRYRDYLRNKAEEVHGLDREARTVIPEGNPKTGLALVLEHTSMEWFLKHEETAHLKAQLANERGYVQVATALLKNQEWLERTHAEVRTICSCLSPYEPYFGHLLELADRVGDAKAQNDLQAFSRCVAEPVARLGEAPLAKLAFDSTILSEIVAGVERDLTVEEMPLNPLLKLTARVKVMKQQLTDFSKEYEVQARIARWALTVSNAYTARCYAAQTKRATCLLEEHHLLHLHSRLIETPDPPVEGLRFPERFAVPRKLLREVLATTVPAKLLDPDLWPFLEQRYSVPSFIADIGGSRLNCSQLCVLDEAAAAAIKPIGLVDNSEGEGLRRYSLASGPLVRQLFAIHFPQYLTDV